MRRREYDTYQQYLDHQLSKTASPRVRRRVQRFWQRDQKLFSAAFELLLPHVLAGSRGICLGARLGCELAVLRGMGFPGSIGIDLVANEPLVVVGDFQQIPFEDDTFDFAFSNALDHVFDLDRFCGEVDRVVRPQGVLLFHAAMKHMKKHESLWIERVEEITSRLPRFRLIHDAPAYAGEKLRALLLVDR